MTDGLGGGTDVTSIFTQIEAPEVRAPCDLKDHNKDAPLRFGRFVLAGMKSLHDKHSREALVILIGEQATDFDKQTTWSARVRVIYAPRITYVHNQHVLKSADLQEVQDVLSQFPQYALLGFARSSSSWPPFIDDDKLHMEEIVKVEPALYYIIVDRDGERFQCYWHSGTELTLVQATHDDVFM